MIGLRMKATMAASTLFLLCLSASWAQQPSNTNDGDSAGIKQSLNDWANAFNRHDAHASVQAFAEDADMVSIAGLRYHGRKAIEDHYSKTFSTTLTNAHRTDTVESIRFLSPEIAAVDDGYELTGSTSKVPGDNSVVPTRKGYYQLIYVKQNGQWLIAVSHEIENETTKK